MGTAYTPGLTVTEAAVVRKERRLPLKGEVHVAIGDTVTPDQVIAWAERPGDIETVRVAESLDVDPDEAMAVLSVAEGDKLERGDLIARYSYFFGLFSSECLAPFAGTVEYVSPSTGHVGLRRPATRIELNAYLPGTVVEVFPDEGVVIECRGAVVQGIFGVGGETSGQLAVVATSPDQVLSPEDVPPHCAGCVLVAGRYVTAEVIRAAAECGAIGVMSGGMLERDLREYLGYEIGVAVTGHEDVPVTLVITEGFGDIPMADRTFELLRGLDGRECSMNGATQVRAGAVRPEVVVPGNEFDKSADSDGSVQTELAEGARIRLIRRPNFGRLAEVTSLPPEPVEVPSGARVRVLEARLDSGEAVLVPRANVEMVQS